MTTDTNGKCAAATNDCTTGAEYLTAAGCKADCEADTYVRKFTDANGKKSCIQDVCDSDKVLKKSDGTCVACDAYTKVKDSKTCAADTCKAREKLLNDGTCGACPDYQNVDPTETLGSNKKCAQPVCKDSDGKVQGNYYVHTDGTCKKCDDYFKADATARDCAPGNLENLGEGKKAAQFILQKDGTAKECTYAKPDATKTSKVNGVDFNIECKATVCDADVKETAVKRNIV